MKNRELCFSALMAALLCLMGPLTVPVGAVPVSVLGFGICLAGSVLGPRSAVFSIGVYILMGAVGFPVFSGWTGGIAHIAGPTGGYILGYLPCAAIAGMSRKGGLRRAIIVMTAGTLAMYVLGTAWFMIQTKTRLSAALIICVLPFIPFDGVKIIAASLVGIRIKGALRME